MSQSATCSRPPLPAYGRELLYLRHQGLVPAGGLTIALDNWSLGRWGYRLVIAPDSDPAVLDFTGAAGLDVLLAVDSRLSDIERRNAAIRAILRVNPAILIELDVNRPCSTRFVKTRTRGVELVEFGTCACP